MKNPACPNCARTMARVPEPELAGPRHDVYRCDPCGVIFSEAAAVRSPATDRALVLNFEVDPVRH